MKKRLIALGLAAALCASVVTAWATGGSAGDPLISLSYLKNIYKPQMTQALQNALYPPPTAGGALRLKSLWISSATNRTTSFKLLPAAK